MATTYALNGTTASLAPYQVRWRLVEIGRDHDGRPLYSGYKEIDLAFEAGSVTYARQWIERASSGSLTLDVLDQVGLGYRTLSGVFMNVVDWPDVQGTWAGQFSLMVTRA
jgi:hypothetical protein